MLAAWAHWMVVVSGPFLSPAICHAQKLYMRKPPRSLDVATFMGGREGPSSAEFHIRERHS
ncbi:hypothetical protein CGRA01v4_12451 [Colletotrichum graminicola]|nr:hypothetical protein CGRA01v4_12451 [Colletotrichum graminicola]